MKTDTIKNAALILGAALILSGCDSSSGSGNTAGPVIDGENLFFFYDHMSQAQYAYHSDEGESQDLNSDSTSNFYMPDKDEGRMIYWPHAITDVNGTVVVDKKVVMVKTSYDFAIDGNLTHENMIYLGHFHGEDLAAHSPDEFDPNSEISATYSEAIKMKKAGALKAFNIYLAEQNEIKEEIEAALATYGETLCNFYVPYIEEEEAHEEEGHEEHSDAHHYALTQGGQLYVFEEGESALDFVQGPITLDGASSCTKDESGITTYSTAKDDEGVFVYMYSSKRLYLMDRHDGAEYHPHSKWDINELLPSSVEPRQMIGFGSADHEDHDHY
ncbi:MAG: hypothetical protein U9N52_03170 [Campylobacterota bacterium]|nr:hypothetical protein [Campylobacterota bacterium]